MRANGVPERFCTGDASDWEKFEAWARTVPETLGNPLYHWTAMELKRPFGIDEALLGPPPRGRSATAATSSSPPTTSRPSGSSRSSRSRWSAPPTTPPTPSRPTPALAAREIPTPGSTPPGGPTRPWPSTTSVSWNAWVEHLERASLVPVGSWQTFLQALEARHTAFHELGCRPRTTASRPSRRAGGRRPGRRGLRPSRAPVASSNRARPWPSAPPCSTTSPSSTTLGAGSSSSTSAPCGTTTPACSATSAPTPASTRWATSSRAGPSPASSTVSTRTTSWPRPSSTT